MRKAGLVLFFTCLLAANGYSQSCNCSENFLFAIQKIKENYIGYNHKVQKYGKEQFQSLTDSLKLLAERSDPHECLEILKRWLLCFKDYHVYASFGYNNATSGQELSDFLRGVRKFSLNEANFLKYLKTKKTDSLEGIWEDNSKTYKVAIIKAKGKRRHSYSAVVLSSKLKYWTQGLVKFKFSKIEDSYVMDFFLTRDFAKANQSIKVDGNIIKIGQLGYWQKLQDAKEGHNGLDGSQKTENPVPPVDGRKPFFRVLDSLNSLLTIPSFRLDYKKAIDSLLYTNNDKITNTKNLIIDLRNNGGGSVLCFEKIIPYLYTHPIITEGASVLATEFNIVNYYENTSYPDLPDSMIASFRATAAKLRQHLGENYTIWPADTIKLNTVYRYPNNVSILVNDNCASAAELFLLKARQSTKVKLFGENTLGAVDYADALTVKMPCNFYTLTYSTSRTNRTENLAIDYIGIKPDIVVPENIKDWIDYVRAFHKLK
jgi:Peptidase family S41